MKRLAIIGAGGHGKVVADAAELSGWERIEFFDIQWPSKKYNGIWEVVGNVNDLSRMLNLYDGVVVAIGNNKTRFQMMKNLESYSPNWVNIVHPGAILSPHIEMGKGVVVFAGAIINPMAKVGNAVIINTGSIIEHDCIIEDAVHICPGVNLAGGVFVGQVSWVGIGASVKQNIKIGSGVMIGAGSVVVNHIDSYQLAYGVPALTKGVWDA